MRLVACNGDVVDLLVMSVMVETSGNRRETSNVFIAACTKLITSAVETRCWR